ncbi:hypothetical protein FRC03_006389 [Tulasnella sp. 419]|nr:hypothetical protein FRC03_006389 [Tulasnella sp. 419]
MERDGDVEDPRAPPTYNYIVSILNRDSLDCEFKGGMSTSAASPLSRFAHFIGLQRHSPQPQSNQQDVDWIPYKRVLSPTFSVKRPSSFIPPSTTFVALDTSIGGGIGESPTPIIHPTPKHHNVLSKPQKVDHTITLGDATSVRTSLLGFGHQNIGTDVQSQFHNPRKAPSVPASPPPVSHPYARHSRNPSIPQRESISPPRATLRQRAKTAESADRSPVQTTFAIIPPPPPIHPYATATPHHFPSDYNPNPRPQLQLETPGAGPSSRPNNTEEMSPTTPSTTKPSHHGHKPPVPPKSAQTLRQVQDLKQQMLKYSSSTPNLLITSHGAPNTSPVVQKVKPAEVGISSAPSAGQLVAQTICDAFMFPRPRFVAHIISPPQSPPDDTEARRPLDLRVTSPEELSPVKSVGHYSPNRPTATFSTGLGLLSPPATPLDLDQVVKEGVQRAKEREEWAQLASSSKLLGNNVPFIVGRGRSRTLSGLKSGGGHKRNESGGNTSERRGSDGKVGLGSLMGKGKSLKVKRSLDYLMMQQQQQQPGGSVRGPSTTVQPEKQATISTVKSDQKHSSLGSSSVGHSHSRKSSGGGGSSSTRSRINRIIGTHSRNNSASHPSVFTSTGQSVVRKVQSFCTSTGGMSPSEDRFGKRLDPPASAPPPTTTTTRDGEGDSFVGGYEDDEWVGVGTGGATIRLTPQSRYEEEMLEALDSSPAKSVRIAGAPIVDIGYANKGKRRVSDGTRSNASPHGWSTSAYSRSPSPSMADHLHHTPPPFHHKMQLEVVQESPLSKAKSLRSSVHDDGAPPFPAHDPNLLDVQFHLAPPPPGRANLTPSPVPSETYTGVGIAVGTPDEMMHPYALPTQEDGDSMIQAEAMKEEEDLHHAGPHLSSPSKAKIALGVVIGTPNDFASRHRLPPSVTTQKQVAPTTTTTTEDEPMHPFDTDSPTSPRSSRDRHPFSSVSPTTSKFPRNNVNYASRAAKKASVNSVEAMFGGELLAASESVSPLGVREAGEEWNKLRFKMGSWNNDEGGGGGKESEEILIQPPVIMIGPGMVNYDYRHSGDSGLGSSTDAHIAKQAQGAGLLEKEKEKVLARTVSSGGSLLVESPPPSMFPVRTLPGSMRQGTESPTLDDDREDVESSPSNYSGSVNGDDEERNEGRLLDSPKSDYGNRSSLFLSMRLDDRENDDDDEDDDESRREIRPDDTATFGGNRPDSMYSRTETDFLSVIQPPPSLPAPTHPAPTHPLPPVPTTPSPPSASPHPSNPTRSNSYHSGEASMVSSNSSGSSASGFVPKPIGGLHGAGSSSDDLDSFKDLFFVPRRMATGAPPSLSRQSSSASPNLRRSMSAGGWSDVAGGDHHTGAQSSDDSFYRQSPVTTFAFPRSESPGVEINTSAGDAWQMPKGRIRSPLSSFHSLDPARASSLLDVATAPLSPSRLFIDPYDGGSSMHGGNNRMSLTQSVYLIPEEDEEMLSVRSSVERFTDENYNLRTIDSQHPTTHLGPRRHSHQFSLVDANEAGLPTTSFTPSLQHSPTIPKPSFLNEDSHLRPPLSLTDPMMRTSFLTTTSGGSNRMSTIISDFPTPPLQGGDVAASIMNYYGVSPVVERSDPLSFADDRSQRTIFASDSSRPRLQRQGTFGSHR